MRRASLHLLLACLAGLLLQPRLCAQKAPEQLSPAIICIVCGKTITTDTIWKHPRGMLCDECAKRETRCFICGLPVKPAAFKTSDGRFICQFDLPNAVLKQELAAQIFEDTRLAVRQLVSPALVLTNPAVTVTLFDVDYWNHRSDGTAPDRMHRLGFSSSRRAGSQLAHSVLLLSGEPRDQMVSTCAHELGHLWVNENAAAKRDFDADSLEAFCELVSWKLAVAQGRTNQLAQLRKNPYTHGQIERFVAFEAEHGFSAVLDWVRDGTSLKLEVPTARAAVNPLLIPTLPRVAPTRLELKGIFRSPQSRLALINGVTFRINEEARVPVGGKQVRVRCLEIQDQTVVLEVEGEAGRVTLTMDAN